MCVYPICVFLLPFLLLLLHCVKNLMCNLETGFWLTAVADVVEGGAQVPESGAEGLRKGKRTMLLENG